MADKESKNKNKDKNPETVDFNPAKIVPLTEAKDTIPLTDNVHAQDTAEEETVSKSKSEAAQPEDSASPSIEKNAEFTSFLQLRDAIEKYQKENSVQLIVKDSKLLRAESTRKIIPKVYHLVNQELMYHSITYTCKCHGELRQRPGTRMKNVGRKRLNCPMYIRFKLTPDCKRLVLFDLYEKHNHGIDTNTCQMAPRQQVYHLSRLKRKRSSEDDEESEFGLNSVDQLISKESSKRDCDKKSERLQPDTNSGHQTSKDSESETPEDPDQAPSQRAASSSRPESPLDSCSSTCSDSDDEEIRNNRRLLPFPIRLIGAAITSNPELIASTKELLEIQKSKLNLEKQKLIMETKVLELTNTKLELEVRQLQKTLSPVASQAHDTTIYLQAP